MNPSGSSPTSPPRLALDPDVLQRRPQVGLYKQEGQWEWLSGELYDDSNWYPGEPNGTGDRGGYLASRTSVVDSTRPSRGPPREPSTAPGCTRTSSATRGSSWSRTDSRNLGHTYSPPIDETLTAFSASFKFSFKNANGGNDGFCFLWGDLSDDSGNRPEGGEYGTFGFLEDGEGLSVGINSYTKGGSRIDGRWVQPFTLTPMTFETSPTPTTRPRDVRSRCRLSRRLACGSGRLRLDRLPVRAHHIVYRTRGSTNSPESIPPTGASVSPVATGRSTWTSFGDFRWTTNTCPRPVDWAVVRATPSTTPTTSTCAAR